MKIKVSEATEFELNYLVGIANGWVNYPNDSIEHGQIWHTDATKAPFGPIRSASDFNPSTDWAQGGPIIERERISVLDLKDKWGAGCNSMGGVNAYGPTPLIAAMRCYVFSMLGDEVDVPDELK